MKTLKNNRFSTTNLNWWRLDFGTINGTNWVSPTFRIILTIQPPCFLHHGWSTYPLPGATYPPWKEGFFNSRPYLKGNHWGFHKSWSWGRLLLWGVTWPQEGRLTSQFHGFFTKKTLRFLGSTSWYLRWFIRIVESENSIWRYLAPEKYRVFYHSCFLLLLCVSVTALYISTTYANNETINLKIKQIMRDMAPLQQGRIGLGGVQVPTVPYLKQGTWWVEPRNLEEKYATVNMGIYSSPKHQRGWKQGNIWNHLYNLGRVA